MIRKFCCSPSDASGGEPEGKITVEENLELSDREGSPETGQQIEGELKAAQIEADQWRDRFLRKAAEFDNYRKRADREKQEASILAKSVILAEFLPVVDACERALGSISEEQGTNESLEQYREGFRLLYKQLRDTLSRLGVVAMAAKGAKFDPHLHEALSREETTEHEEDTVIQELRKGYLFRDRLLRPAQVTVSIRPMAREESSAHSRGEK